MTHTSPNWMLLKAAAEELTQRGLSPFTRQQLIAAVQARYPDRAATSLQPMIQGMTVNLKGGAPGGIGKEVFRSVGRGLFELIQTDYGAAVAPTEPYSAPILSPSAHASISSESLVLVSCVKSKATRRAPAQDLYTSAWFRKARGYAEAAGGPWFILSAQYGLVAPDTLLEPYELTLNDMGVAERRRWTATVMAQLGPLLTPQQPVILLAGGRYREFLSPELEALGSEVQTPLARIAGLGPQQNWLEANTRRPT